MTGPITASVPDPRLVAVAAWDVGRVTHAVATLADVSARLVGRRARLEALGRALASGDCWTGAAATSAVSSMDELAAATWAVDAAVHRSLDACLRMGSEAIAAQESAELAIAGAAAAGTGGTGAALGGLASAMAGRDRGPEEPTSWPAAARAALAHADAAAAAAREADRDLSGLGVRDAFGPAHFGDLLAHVRPGAPPEVPDPGPPSDIATWWAGLSSAAQEAAISTAPAAVGALDGLPAWARDRANRLLLRRALEDPQTADGAEASARVVAARIAAEERAGRRVQLQLLDLAGDRVALAIGDLDTADSVALLVPGIHNTPADDLSGLTGDAVDLVAAARTADPSGAVAAMVWLGYRTPANPAEAIGRAHALRGGPQLARALDGLAAARRTTGREGARTTVVAHSYGTVVVDEAADVPGDLAADALVLLGSPGMEDDAGTLEASAVFDAAAEADLVARFGIFGDHATWADSYGSTHLPTEGGMGHSDYFDPGRPTLAAVGAVVAGTRLAE
jgi:hypothetical protein